MQDGATEFTNFMIRFYEQFPELRENDFYLTGESYAGKYLPLFSKTLLERNKAVEEGDKINLKATLIIDPYPSPEI